MLYEQVDFACNTPIKICCVEIDEYPLHMHRNAFEIIYLLEGSMQVDLVNEELQMKPGDIHVCNLHELHRYRGTGEGNAAILLYLNLDAYREDYPELETYLFTSRAIDQESRAMEALRRCLKKLVSEMLVRPVGAAQTLEMGREVLKILMHEFQYYYLGNYRLQSSNIYRHNEVQQDRIRRTVDFMYKNCNKNIRIEDVANRENISPYHLTYILKSGCGMGFRMFLNMVRAEKSAIMILETELSLQHISYEHGFSKYQYFTESFQKVFGMTPLEYRKKYQEETIMHKPVKMRFLDKAVIEDLSGSSSDQFESITIDRAARAEETVFQRYEQVQIDGGSYRHGVQYEYLRVCTKKLGLRVLRVDGGLFLRYKNRNDQLRHILSDFLALYLQLHFYLDDSVDMRQLELILRFLDEQMAVTERHRVQFMLLWEDPAQMGKERPVEELLESYGFSVEHVRPRAPIEGNPLYGSGYMPAFLLRSLYRDDRRLKEALSLTDGWDSDGEKWSDFALWTSQGLKKPAWYLHQMLRQMGDRLLFSGDSYFVTSGRKGNDFQILFYHYDDSCDSLFDDTHGETARSTLVHSIEQKGLSEKVFSINIENIYGAYVIKKYRLACHDFLSVYDPAALPVDTATEETKFVLDQIFSPDVSLHVVKAEGSYQIEQSLEPFHIMLITFEKV